MGYLIAGPVGYALADAAWLRWSLVAMTAVVVALLVALLWPWKRVEPPLEQPTAAVEASLVRVVGLLTELEFVNGNGIAARVANDELVRCRASIEALHLALLGELVRLNRGGEPVDDAARPSPARRARSLCEVRASNRPANAR